MDNLGGTPSSEPIPPTRRPGRPFSLAGEVGMTRSSNKTASVGKTVVPLIALLAFTIPLAESVRRGEAAEQKKDNPALNERVAAINKLVAGDYERLEKLYK